jgi:Fe-S-cluster containining protein
MMALALRFQVNHPVIERVDGDIFIFTFAPDCMTHACRCVTEGDLARTDACCQHGADVLVPEKAAILRRSAEIASVMRPGRGDPAHWFDERDPEIDADAPQGIILRTATSDLGDDTSGCVFLEHTGERGCGLHRAALAHGFSPLEIKPRVCRLYPLSWDKRALGLSPDFDRYSCANDAGPSVYRLMRGAVLEIFGESLVVELDRLEKKALRRRLRVLARPTSASDSPAE